MALEDPGGGQHHGPWHSVTTGLPLWTNSRTSSRAVRTGGAGRD